MTTSHQPTTDGRRGLSRRHLLLGGAAAGIGAVGAVGIDAAVRSSDGQHAEPAPTPSPTAHEAWGVEPFYGIHQSGITTTPPAFTTFLAFDLLPTTDRGAIERMLRILTDDAAKLTQARSALADSEPELAEVAAHLTVTFGFGPELVRRVNAGLLPEWLAPLPAFSKDALDEANSHGDLLLQVGSDDALTLSHCIRMLSKDARTFATLRWSQAGFRSAKGSQPQGTTMRNLFGQVDGTVNPVPGSDDFAGVVWSGAQPGWMAGGTSFVLRRIAMNLDTWDMVDRVGRESAVGRTLSNGAPLTGAEEHDETDFEATNALGFPVIAAESHIRRARSENTSERIFRRGYNYDDGPTTGADGNAGLLFASYQADPVAQFVPLQQRLDDLDMLNEWISHVGSAVFAIPGGCAEGGFVGEQLFQ